MIKKTKNKGFFITFEGLDGCGKSTIVKQIYTLLKKKYAKKIFVTREPGGTNNKIGEKIRNILLNENNCKFTPITETLLFAASRAQHVNDFIKPHLQKNHIILCDRFLHSSLVYQGYVKKVGFDNVFTINKYALDNIMPNLIFLLLTKTETSLKRIAKDNERKKNWFDKQEPHIHNLICAGYLQMMKKYPKNLVVINANQPIKNVVDDVKKILLQKLAKYYDK